MPVLRVAIPVADRIYNHCLDSLYELKQCRDFRYDSDLVINNRATPARIARGVPYIDMLRNALVAEPGDYDYMLCVDTDIAFTVADIKRLVEHDKDIVGAAYPYKDSPNVYVCGCWGEIKGLVKKENNLTRLSPGMQKVDWTGMGCTLIKKCVLNNPKWKRNWFRRPFIEVMGEERQPGEDIGFCMKAQELGFEIWADCDCGIEHKR